MKRLIGLMCFGCFAAAVCFVVESEAATSKNVSDLSNLTPYEYHGFDFDYELAVLAPEILNYADHSYTFAVQGSKPNVVYKSLPIPACRSPGKITPKRF